MPLTRKPLTRKAHKTLGRKRDAVDLTDYDDEDEDDDAEEEAPRRRGLGKRLGGTAAAAFKEGTKEGRRRRVSRDDMKSDAELAAEDDGDEDDDEPAQTVVKRGWAAARRAKQASASFADEFKFDQEESLVRFLEDEPFAVFSQHWIEGGLSSTKKKSFICLGKGCPLCDIGDANPRPMFVFNIAVIDEDQVTCQALVAGTRLLGQIEQAHNSKAGPLSKGFWSLAKTGKKQTTAYVLQAVKPRDLEEDWGVSLEEVEADIKKLKPYTGDAYKPMTKRELQEIADELSEDED